MLRNSHNMDNFPPIILYIRVSSNSMYQILIIGVNYSKILAIRMLGNSKVFRNRLNSRWILIVTLSPYYIPFFNIYKWNLTPSPS